MALASDKNDYDINQNHVAVNVPLAPSNGTSTSPSIAVIGAGVSGICAAIKLKTQLRITDFTIFEGHSEVGGTWLANTYPGCACDIESHLYSFSFELNPFWSKNYSHQPEILEYLKKVATKHDIYRHISFGTSVKSLIWDSVACNWKVSLVDQNRNSKELVYDIVINGPGALRIPNIPDQFRAFKGPLMHSAEWNHQIDFTNKVVAVVGTGASAIQIIPAIAGDVKELRVYQRRAPYVVPRIQFSHPKFLQWIFYYVPCMMWLFRALIFLTHESYLSAFKNGSFMNWFGGKFANFYMRRSVNDPEIRAKLVPGYRFGCKRVMVSSDFYRTFNRPNVKLVTSKIIQVGERSISTEASDLSSSAESVDIDVLILCTGFRVQDYFAPMQIIGRENVNALEEWKLSGPRTYYGTVAHGAPNSFILLGPNTALGHNGVYFMIECQANLIMKLIKELIRRNAKTVEVKKEAQDKFMESIKDKMKSTIWGNESCGSWYASENGDIFALWPESCISYWFKMKYHTKFHSFEFK